MHNKISDLNNFLFAQLERLDEEEIDAEKMHLEIERSRSIAVIASQIIQTGKLALQARACIDSAKVDYLPEFLEDEKERKQISN